MWALPTLIDNNSKVTGICYQLLPTFHRGRNRAEFPSDRTVLPNRNILALWYFQNKVGQANNIPYLYKIRELIKNANYSMFAE